MWLPWVRRVATAKTSSRGRTPCDLAVIHYTATPWGGPSGGSDPARQARWLGDASRKSSTHIIIMRDGSVIQAAQFEVATWHAGGSAWRGETNVNARSVGIDLDNVGWLTMAADGRARDAYGGVHRGPVVEVGGRLWEPYTAAACASLLRVVAAVAGAVPVLRDPARWVGHEHIRATKSDPGPALPWPWVHAALAPDFDPAAPIDWSAVPHVVTP
jgi:N-acetyl-anhydromuramyl-L-alanine amidase AmpD